MRAQPLERQDRVGRVVEEAAAPHDLVRADLGDRRGVVQVAAHEADGRAAPRVLALELGRGGHHVDAR